MSDLSLDIADGEFLVLVGPSGCGKSTALRMVAGLETITSGTLTIAGKRMNDVEPKDRNVAMVFQNYALYPHLDVARNIGYNGQPPDSQPRQAMVETRRNPRLETT
ncbi:MAG TPA: ATP-binding cassette domain-containing protein [Acidimicrobiales bacterium]|nr:ATP-binding cassette domain-containing protein [Acidimicrobiales bacterium]MDP6213823.1 ATP-binding cassette domain-containing protein [Acidimicrobiales bacterium]MDP7209495.1 ATP-binding cassette domain-containing protein [Acidimicrobiales bacterium]HJL89047.1 ATP-binding cassette domain-containing protein [Acidimicrobiales bacterium]HJO98355.1 ATP-binding cassette domain-containing protein [Acidimicrobiales bacterium]